MSDHQQLRVFTVPSCNTTKVVRKYTEGWGFALSREPLVCERRGLEFEQMQGGSRCKGYSQRFQAGGPASGYSCCEQQSEGRQSLRASIVSLIEGARGSSLAVSAYL
jgi:hypothetical protein